MSSKTKPSPQWPVPGMALGDDGMIGAIVSDRSIIGTQKRHHLFGMDGRVALTDALNIEGAVLASSTKGIGQDGNFAPAAVIRKRWNGSRVESFLEATYIAKDFRSENGFQPLADWMSINHETEFFIFPKAGPIPRIFFQPTTGEVAWTTDGKPRLYNYEPVFGFWTSGGALFWFEGEFEGESYADSGSIPLAAASWREAHGHGGFARGCGRVPVKGCSTTSPTLTWAT